MIARSPKLILSLILALLVSSFVGLSASAKTKKAAKPKGPTSTTIAMTYSIEQIEQVSNYLLARVEADPLPKNAKLISCDPSMMKVNAWLSGPVHAIADEKRGLTTDAYKAAPKEFASKVRGCADRCSCNAYQALFEDVGEALKDSPDHAKNVVQMKLEMRKVGKDQSLKCAKELTWFCGSPFHKFLESQ